MRSFGKNLPVAENPTKPQVTMSILNWTYLKYIKVDFFFRNSTDLVYILGLSLTVIIMY